MIDMPVAWLKPFLAQNPNRSQEKYREMIKGGWDRDYPAILGCNHRYGMRVMDGTRRIYAMLESGHHPQTEIPVIISFGSDLILHIVEAHAVPQVGTTRKI